MTRDTLIFFRGLVFINKYVFARILFRSKHKNKRVLKQCVVKSSVVLFIHPPFELSNFRTFEISISTWLD